MTGELFEGPLGATKVRAELLGGLAGDELVAVAVTGYLVAGPHHSFHHRGVRLGYLPDNEEGGARAVPDQDVEHDVNTLLDTAGKLAPFVLGDCRLELQAMIVLLDVDAERVDDHCAPRPKSAIFTVSTRMRRSSQKDMCLM